MFQSEEQGQEKRIASAVVSHPWPHTVTLRDLGGGGCWYQGRLGLQASFSWSHHPEPTRPERPPTYCLSQAVSGEDSNSRSAGWWWHMPLIQALGPPGQPVYRVSSRTTTTAEREREHQPNPCLLSGNQGSLVLRPAKESSLWPGLLRAADGWTNEPEQPLG